jgi:predicted esterase
MMFKATTPLKTIFSDSKDKVNSNLLILLHGIGDTSENFNKFGTALQLPQTAILSVKAPCPIPYFDTETSWFPAFDMKGEELPTDAEVVHQGWNKTRELLIDLLKGFCIYNKLENTGWPSERIFILGFGQGGQVALDLAIRLSNETSFGGVISISGYLDLTSFQASGQAEKIKGILLIGKEENGIESQLSLMRGKLEKVDQIVFPRGLSMPSTALEMRSIHTFFR